MCCAKRGLMESAFRTDSQIVSINGKLEEDTFLDKTLQKIDMKRKQS